MGVGGSRSATLDPSSGRLWPTATAISLTILTAHALGRALHSAGLAGPLPWPNGRDLVTTSDTLQRLPRAPRRRISRRPRHVTHAARDRATGQGVGADGEWSRLSHLGPAGSVADEREAAVEAAAEHRLRAPEEQVRRRLLDERGWACDHAHGAGMLGTDEGSNAVVLTDGFRAN